MLFSFGGRITAQGFHKISNFGDVSPAEASGMPGYMRKQRYGFLHFFGDLAGCTARVVGYQQHSVQDFSLPGAVLIELPCEWRIDGPEGTEFLVEAWEVSGFSHRGAKASLYAEGNGSSLSGAVPEWASSFDAQGEGGGFFSDAAFTAQVGVFAAGSTAVSIPTNARFVRMPATGTSNTQKSITFRQL